MISLIITIIVIIILAAIVIFTGLNTPDRANFAKFVSEFSDFRTAVQQDYFAKKTKFSVDYCRCAQLMTFKQFLKISFSV